MGLQSYRDLEVWQVAMDLVEATYILTRQYPKEERYGLTSQTQRAAVSVPANISEGYGRTHRGDYKRFLSIARGSLCELETHFTIAVRLGYIPREIMLPPWELAQSVGKMLRKLIASLGDAPQESD